MKHRRELLFAALPTLFAIHQFIEGFVWLGLDGILSPAVAHDMGAAFMLYAQGLLPFLLPMSVLLFEPDAKSRRRMLPFLVLGGATTLYILWALTAFPLQLYVRGNSIVYINQATNNTAVAVLYVIATCGSLFFSKIKMMVIFGAANLTILLVVMAVKRYAFTSLWCAYAAVASVIILAYFWTSTKTGLSSTRSAGGLARSSSSRMDGGPFKPSFLGLSGASIPTRSVSLRLSGFRSGSHVPPYISQRARNLEWANRNFFHPASPENRSKRRKLSLAA